MTACAGCAAPIVWARTETGGHMPLDRMPAPSGNVVWIDDHTVRVLPPGTPPDDRTRFRSHFVTCPKSSEFRGAKHPGQGSML